MRRFLLLLMAFVAAPLFAAIPASERNALISLYNATNGAAWTTSSGWLGAPGSECSWVGITCDSAQTNVVAISLGSNNLTGTLPSDIGAFSKLDTLELFGNRIGGSLPPQLGNLTTLTRLALFSNVFTGTIPRELGQLTNLQTLTLGDNQLTGAIPPELGNLTKVVFLSFNGNRLSGPLPNELGNLASVETLDFSASQIGGPIPATFGRLTKLRELYLNDNRLTGSIPRELGSLPALTELDLSINSLSGPIPPELGQSGTLRTLNFFQNDLTGPIPSALGNLQSLTFLALGFNELTGSIPAELGKLSNLSTLELNANQLTGTIPPALSRLSLLQRLDLSTNQLTGTIPPELGALTELLVLGLSENDLTGVIPRELGALKKLVSLSAYGMDLTGGIPEELYGLTDFQEIVLFDNELTGSISTAIGQLTKLRYLAFGGNRLTGVIPPQIGSLTELTFLDLRGNQLGGTIPSTITSLGKLEYFSLEGNRVGGQLPSDLGNLTALTLFRVDSNELEGPVPASIGALTNLQDLLLTNNHFIGPFPVVATDLTNLRSLRLGGNQFDGPIPPQISKLRNLVVLDVSNNAFRGDIPAEIVTLTNLADNLSNFGFNLLVSPSLAVQTFVNRKHDGGDFEASQTIPPTDVTIDALTDRSVVLSWTLPRYTSDPGGYRVSISTPGGTLVAVATTPSKDISTILVKGLSSSTSYVARVSTVTHPHGLQQNTLTSDPASAVSFTTAVAVVLPADLEVTTTPDPLVQLGGTPQNETTFTIVNNGDASSSITLNASGGFFSVTPVSFTIDGGKSQIVRVRSISQPAGSYEGSIGISGPGAAPGFSVAVRLVSIAPPAGTAIAEPVTSRVDFSGEPGTDTAGVVTFINRGTATLVGLAAADVPWIVPGSTLVTIAPGATADVAFTIRRNLRPDASGSEAAALSGTLRLVYLDGTPSGKSLQDLDPDDAPSGGVGISLVGVIDTSRPAATPGAIPPLVPGEVARFITGLAPRRSGLSRIVSDLSVANSFGSAPVRDLRFYFTPAGGQGSSSVPSAPLVPNQSLQLADALRSVLGGAAEVGSVQLRSRDSDRVLVGARLVETGTGEGTFSTILPVFRSDRSVGAGESLHLPGVVKNDTSRTAVYVQETSGSAAAVRIEQWNAAGAVIRTREISVPPFGLVEVQDEVVRGAITLVITNTSASAGRVQAVAVISMAGGETRSIVDWRRYHGFAADSEVRIPFVRNDGAARRRRSSRVARSAAAASIDSVTTELTMFNPGAETAQLLVQYFDAAGSRFSREVEIESRRTRLFSDALAQLFGRGGATQGHLVVTPLRGNVAISAYTGRRDGVGSVIPVVSNGSGLRLGQSQQFAAVEDAGEIAINGAIGGTYRSGFGVVETSGQRAKIRATILYYDGRGLAAAFRSKEYEVGPRELLVVDRVARSIVGPDRDAVGNLHDLQLQLQVIEGAGSVNVFTTSTDNGTGDVTIRFE